MTIILREGIIVMNFLNIFKRSNKNAVTRPGNLKSFKSITDVYAENESVSFSDIDKISTAFSMLSFGVYQKKIIKN